jgi:hypothetical protein
MRIRPLGLLLSGVVIASSACSMDATAPSSLAVPQSAMMAKGQQTGEWHDEGLAEASTTYRVTINPQRRNLLRFGAHTLDIPAKAVCSARSGYGPDVFDDDCKGEKDPVTITAIVRTTQDGTPRIDLIPEMRFDPKHRVTLTLFVPTLTPASPRGSILYCATHSISACIDESLLDPTLVTQADYREHTLSRRIKHFSGYFVEH